MKNAAGLTFLQTNFYHITSLFKNLRLTPSPHEGKRVESEGAKEKCLSDLQGASLSDHSSVLILTS